MQVAKPGSVGYQANLLDAVNIRLQLPIAGRQLTRLVSPRTCCQVEAVRMAELIN